MNDKERDDLRAERDRLTERVRSLENLPETRTCSCGTVFPIDVNRPHRLTCDVCVLKNIEKICDECGGDVDCHSDGCPRSQTVRERDDARAERDTYRREKTDTLLAFDRERIQRDEARAEVKRQMKIADTRELEREAAIGEHAVKMGRIVKEAEAERDEAHRLAKHHNERWRELEEDAARLREALAEWGDWLVANSDSGLSVPTKAAAAAMAAVTSKDRFETKVRP